MSMHGAVRVGVWEGHLLRVDLESASARKTRLTFERGNGPVFSTDADQRSVPLYKENVPSTTKLPSLSSASLTDVVKK
jgi:hypothetical protein